MLNRLSENVVQELKALSTDELQEILGFNRLLRDAAGFRSALDPAIESLLDERRAQRRPRFRRYPLRSVSCVTPIPQS
jgi:hypothetical protein